MLENLAVYCIGRFCLTAVTNALNHLNLWKTTGEFAVSLTNERSCILLLGSKSGMSRLLGFFPLNSWHVQDKINIWSWNTEMCVFHLKNPIRQILITSR